MVSRAQCERVAHVATEACFAVAGKGKKRAKGKSAQNTLDSALPSAGCPKSAAAQEAAKDGSSETPPPPQRQASQHSDSGATPISTGRAPGSDETLPHVAQLPEAPAKVLDLATLKAKAPEPDEWARVAGRPATRSRRPGDADGAQEQLTKKQRENRRRAEKLKVERERLRLAAQGQL